MAGTRWLDADQQHAWRAFIQGSARLDAALDGDLREYGLGIGEYQILVQLSEAPDRRVRLADLADKVTHSRSRMSHTMDRMAKAGWVERTRSETDRRGIEARLTDEGFALLRRLAPVHVAAVRELFVDVAGDRFDMIGAVFADVAAAVDARPACQRARSRQAEECAAAESAAVIDPPADRDGTLSSA